MGLDLVVGRFERLLKNPINLDDLEMHKFFSYVCSQQYAYIKPQSKTCVSLWEGWYTLHPKLQKAVSLITKLCILGSLWWTIEPIVLIFGCIKYYSIVLANLQLNLVLDVVGFLVVCRVFPPC